MTGFEPAAFASRTQRSTKLSHIPKIETANCDLDYISTFSVEIQGLMRKKSKKVHTDFYERGLMWKPVCTAENCELLFASEVLGL